MINSLPIVNTTPSLKELQQHFTPHYAADWKVIGILLGLPSGTLDIIANDYRDKAEPCCTAMLRKWLELDPSAAWKYLFEAIGEPFSGGSADKGDYSYSYTNCVAIYSEHHLTSPYIDITS